MLNKKTASKYFKVKKYQEKIRKREHCIKALAKDAKKYRNISDMFKT